MNDKRPDRPVYIALFGVLKPGFNALLRGVHQKLKNEITRFEKGRAPRQSEAPQESDGLFLRLERYIPDIITIFEADGTLRYASPSLERVLGYKPEDLVGNIPLELLHPGDVELVMSTFAEIRDISGANPLVEARVRQADGSWRCLEATSSNLLGDPGVRGVVIVLRDVTERKRVEEELRRRERSLAAAQRIAHVGNWEYFVDKDEAYWSDEMYRILGLSPREFVPKYKTFLRFVHPDDKVLVRRTVREVLYAGRNPSLDYRVVRPDGEVRSVCTRYEVLRDESGKPTRIVGTVHDITERKALEERLEHQAFHDSLTGLPNRALFVDRLGHALARVERHGRSVAVLFLDLDDFKLVNDSFGHEVGDRLLIEAAGRLKECVRPQDTVARLGGDEFTVLLEDVENVEDATHVAERVTEALRTPFDLGEHRLSTGASIGVVLGTSAVRDRPEDLLRDADLALYEAKRRGKARYEVFDPGSNQRLAKRLKLKRELGRALERDEFRVLYQPKMLLRTGGIIGTEALLRWEHPERGLIPPAEFVPLAEETGLIIPIGYKVLEEACQQARSWQERYPNAPQTMYINLSSRQFNDPELVEEVTKVVRETGVEPCGLALEISENVLMSDPQSTLDKLRSLRELGARVVVDNFGTAYSSLSRLGHLPMNSLNVDRSLIFRLGVAPEDTAIVAASINLAHSLGWEVTAEGVETADQLDQLRELGCDMAQGYHLWEPLTGEEVSASLATGPPR